MLTFEGQQYQGTANIVEKFRSTGGAQHSVKSVDVQPSKDPSSILIFVTGSVKLAGQEHPLHFCEMFQLVGTNGSYYIHNDVFRLNYGL